MTKRTPKTAVPNPFRAKTPDEIWADEAEFLRAPAHPNAYPACQGYHPVFQQKSMFGQRNARATHLVQYADGSYERLCARCVTAARHGHGTLMAREIVARTQPIRSILAGSRTPAFRPLRDVPG